MSTPVYAVADLILGPSATFSAQVQSLQTDLRALGYGKGPIDGVFGTGTQTAVRALQYDLMNNNGASTTNDGSAPVSIRNYNNSSVTALTGVVDQGLVSCMASMLADPVYPKLPYSLNPSSDNQDAIAKVQTMSPCPVPISFLVAVLFQESNWQHYQVPSTSNRDHYVTVGLDRNNHSNPAAITSRGYGIGQFTLFHHPPTADEIENEIKDPIRNVSRAISDLLNKYKSYVVGPIDKADDRMAEAGSGTLRPCQFPASDARYMKACGTCLHAATSVNIVAGKTVFYAGCDESYDRTQYHVGSYSGVPERKSIPCDWPYAIRRYNGSGVNSYDYQAEVLQRMLTTARD